MTTVRPSARPVTTAPRRSSREARREPARRVCVRHRRSPHPTAATDRVAWARMVPGSVAARCLRLSGPGVADRAPRVRDANPAEAPSRLPGPSSYRHDWKDPMHQSPRLARHAPPGRHRSDVHRRPGAPEPHGPRPNARVAVQPQQSGAPGTTIRGGEPAHSDDGRAWSSQPHAKRCIRPGSQPPRNGNRRAWSSQPRAKRRAGEAVGELNPMQSGTRSAEAASIPEPARRIPARQTAAPHGWGPTSPAVRPWASGWGFARRIWGGSWLPPTAPSPRPPPARGGGVMPFLSRQARLGGSTPCKAERRADPPEATAAANRCASQAKPVRIASSLFLHKGRARPKSGTRPTHQGAPWVITLSSHAVLKNPAFPRADPVGVSHERHSVAQPHNSTPCKAVPDCPRSPSYRTAHKPRRPARAASSARDRSDWVRSARAHPAATNARFNAAP